MSTSGSGDGPSPSQRIDGRIAELGDWRGELLARLRALIHEAVPDVVSTLISKAKRPGLEYLDRFGRTVPW